MITYFVSQKLLEAMFEEPGSDLKVKLGKDQKLNIYI